MTTTKATAATNGETPSLSHPIQTGNQGGIDSKSTRADEDDIYGAYEFEADGDESWPRRGTRRRGQRWIGSRPPNAVRPQSKKGIQAILRAASRNNNNISGRRGRQEGGCQDRPGQTPTAAEGGRFPASDGIARDAGGWSATRTEREPGPCVATADMGKGRGRISGRGEGSRGAARAALEREIDDL